MLSIVFGSSGGMPTGKKGRARRLGKASGLSVRRGEIIAATLAGALGLFIFVESLSLDIMRFGQIGSGAMPMALGTLIVFFSLILIVSSDYPDGEKKEVNFSVPGAIFSLVGMVLWAIVAPRYGIVPATVVLVLVSCLFYRPLRPLTIVLNMIFLSAFGVLLFVYALSIPLAAIKVPG